MDLIKRFNEKVDKTSDCWLWKAAKDKDGYGKFKMNRKDYQAHRASWEISIAPINPGMCVLHRCDVPSCVNPDHLFLGTRLENNQDRDAKGRNGYSKRTHCPRGHEYSLQNTTVWRGNRKCRKCKREYDKRRLAS